MRGRYRTRHPSKSNALSTIMSSKECDDTTKLFYCWQAVSLSAKLRLGLACTQAHIPLVKMCLSERKFGCSTQITTSGHICLHLLLHAPLPHVVEANESLTAVHVWGNKHRGMFHYASKSVGGQHCAPNWMRRSTEPEMLGRARSKSVPEGEAESAGMLPAEPTVNTINGELFS